jgi:hypothetical protein
MALKALVKSLDEVPQEFRSLYTQDGDHFVLDVDDKDFKTQLQEFRTNNIDLTKRNRDLEAKAKEAETLRAEIAKYKDIDPAKARDALDKLQGLEEQRLIDAGKLDEVVEQRVAQRIERMRSDYEGQVTALNKSLDEITKARDTYKGQLSEVVIDNSLQQSVGTVATVRQGAMRDVLARGRATWKLDDDGKPVPYGPDGNVMYGKDGKKTLTMEEWAQSLIQEANYLFEPNSGGGAPGNQRSSNEAGSVIDIQDQDALNANIEAIAEGKVAVR